MHRLATQSMNSSQSRVKRGSSPVGTGPVISTASGMMVELMPRADGRVKFSAGFQRRVRAVGMSTSAETAWWAPGYNFLAIKNGASPAAAPSAKAGAPVRAFFQLGPIITTTARAARKGAAMRVLLVTRPPRRPAISAKKGFFHDVFRFCSAQRMASMDSIMNAG